MDNYLEINKAAWNAKVDPHYESDFYDLKGFLAGNTSLNKIELELLGNIKEKTVLHLQCHFGQDSISLSKLGAQVTAIDLSDKAIQKGKELAQQMNEDVEFICTDVYNLPHVLNKKFDLVFTSYGTIGWLPDLNKWAGVVSQFLKSGGKFVFVEFHPMVWMFDDNFENITYSYFNKQVIEEVEQGTYADESANIETKTISWNHPLTDVFTSLLNNSLEIKDFKEYDYSPYNCFANTVKINNKQYMIKGLAEKLPMVYSIVASK